MGALTNWCEWSTKFPSLHRLVGCFEEHFVCPVLHRLLSIPSWIEKPYLMWPFSCNITLIDRRGTTLADSNIISRDNRPEGTEAAAPLLPPLLFPTLCHRDLSLIVIDKIWAEDLYGHFKRRAVFNAHKGLPRIFYLTCEMKPRQWVVFVMLITRAWSCL